MTEEEKIYLYELNQTFADGFSRGYNRGFMDGIRIAEEIHRDEKLMKQMGVEVEKNK